MANEVKIRVTVDNDAKRGLNDVGSDLNQLTIKAYGAEKSMDSLSRNMTESDRIARITAHSYDSVSEELAQLDRHLAVSTAEMRIFASALIDTNDAAQRLDISKAMSKLRSDIANTTRAKKIKLAELVDLTPDSAMVGRFSRAFAPVLEAAGAHVGPVVGLAVGAAAAPFIASTLGAAVVGGIGVGGLIGGVTLAAKDPRVAESAKSIGKTFMDNITAKASVFVGPVLGALNQVSVFAESAGKKIGDIFAATSKHVQPLTASILRAGDAILNSFVNAAKSSGPAIDALGDSIELLSDGVSNVINTFSRMGPTGADNLRLVAGVMADVITHTGNLLGLLNDLGKHAWITGPLLPLLRDHYKDVAEETQNASDGTKNLSGSMNDAAAAAEAEQTAMKSLTTELRKQNDPVFALLTAQDDLASAQKRVATATKKHGANSLEARIALRQLGVAALDLRTSVGNLGGSFDGKLSPSMRRTLEAAKLTKAQIDRLETEFMQAKTAADKLAGNYRVNVHYKVTRENFVGPIAPGSGWSRKASGGIVGAAAGGGIRTGLTLVGEEGPELAQLPPGTQVTPAGGTRRMMESMARNAGPSELLVRAAPRASRDLIEVLIESLRYEVRRQGGIVQDVLGKRAA